AVDGLGLSTNSPFPESEHQAVEPVQLQVANLGSGFAQRPLQGQHNGLVGTGGARVTKADGDGTVVRPGLAQLQSGPLFFGSGQPPFASWYTTLLQDCLSAHGIGSGAHACIVPSRPFLPGGRAVHVSCSGVSGPSRSQPSGNENGRSVSNG